ncbi:MAG: bifunctional folylpolyglutamate synthase/dihydrofolate synthase [Bacteroidia bacterium]|nr:bifunctional folylpolyglutamate synthase/dihydrofolate synthase [Bacteroidia bacterium]
MTYNETLKFLYSQLPMYQRQGAAAYKADLNNTIALCKALNDPQQNLKCIHIAGTNGKGSISHMLASIFEVAGYKTGLYTSPHYKDFRERIKINGKMISKNYVSDFVAGQKKLIKDLQPSFFELTVGMAFQYFNEKKVDIAIIETGMGGRLDSTNIIDPELSIITNISLDHTAFLGKTIRKIALEKAGIIKHHKPIIIGKYQDDTADIFKKIAKQKKSDIHFSSYSVNAKKLRSSDLSCSYFDVKMRSGQVYKKLALPLSGDYQIENLKTVLKSCEVLRDLGYKLSKAHIIKGLAEVKSRTGILGRFECISSSPNIVVDGAHNEVGMMSVLKQIRALKYEQLHVVYGVVNDKDLNKIMALLPKDAIYYWCAADIPRALDPKVLKNEGKSRGLSGKNYGSVRSALNEAKKAASINDLIYVGGSIFVAAEVL